MKRFLYLFIFCFIVLSSCNVYATEYVVKKDECLWIIAKKVNVSAKDLAVFNYLPNEDLIFPGQKIHYVSEKDLERARAWAARHVEALYAAGIDHELFKLVIKNIDTGRIVYSPDESDGTFAGLILQYAAAWAHFIK